MIRPDLLIAAVLVSLSVGESCFAADQHVDCLTLMQSQSSAGTYKTTLTRDAMKMERSGSPVFLIARAPEWRVVFFNSRSKEGMDLSFQEWLRHDANWTTLPPMTDAATAKLDLHNYNGSFERTGTVSYCGEKCLRYSMVRRENGRLDPKHRYSQEFYVFPKESFPSQSYTYPLHFKKVNREFDVITDKSTNQAGAEAFELIKGGEAADVLPKSKR